MDRARIWVKRIIPGKNCFDSYVDGDVDAPAAAGNSDPSWRKRILTNVVSGVVPSSLLFRRTKSEERSAPLSSFSTQSDESSTGRGIPLSFSLSLTSDRPGRRGRRKGDRRGLFSPDVWRSKKHFRQLDEVSASAVERELFKRLSRFEEED